MELDKNLNKNLHTHMIEKAINGDSDALEELLRAYTNTIVFHVANLVDNVQDREDVFQQIVLSIEQGIKNVKSPYAFSAWLNKVIENNCYDNNAKVSRNRKHFVSMDKARNISEESVDALPYEHAEQNELSETMHGILEHLPKAQREAIFLFYFDGLKYREIAKTLGIKESTVATNIMKAKRNILRLIAEADLSSELLSKITDGEDSPELGKAIVSGFSIVGVSDVAGAQANTLAGHVGNAIVHKAPLTKLQKITHLKYAKATLGVMGAAAVAVGLFVGLHAPAPAPAKAPVPAPVEEPAEESQTYEFKPDAAIAMTSAKYPKDSTGSNTNPEHIELKLGSVQAEIVSWEISTSGGDIAASGTGSVAAVPKSPGEYKVSYKLQDQYGTIAVASRVFYVD